jgi:hypothetical protein
MKMSLLMSGGSVWIQIEVLPIRLRVLLSMPMKEGLKLAADEAGSDAGERRLEDCCR